MGGLFSKAGNSPNYDKRVQQDSKLKVIDASLGSMINGGNSRNTPLNLEIPIADKRINALKSQGLLKSASDKALSDLITPQCIPNIEELSRVKFPFKNAVFEGGGVKGIAYVGAIKCLEDVGIKIERFAGSSIGATVAGLLSVGYTADELVTLYIQDLSIFIRDSRCELLCFLPRLLRNLGMNPGKKFVDWYGRCLAVKTGNPDITFKEVFDHFGTELCVVVLNMNTGREEYFHPKTTPDLSVRIAVRMSISVPGVLQPIHLLHTGGDLDTYIDGGVICNYPIYVFDGWWLSMEPHNQLYHKMKDVEGYQGKQSFSHIFDKQSRFLERNDKTLGFKQTTHNDFFNDTIITKAIVDESSSNKRTCYYHSRPDTKLSRKRMKEIVAHETYADVKSMQLGALMRFFQILQSCSDELGYVIKDKLLTVLQTLEDSQFTRKHFQLLFGNSTSPNELLQNIPLQANQKTISPSDLDLHLKNFGLDMQRMLEASLVLRQTMEGPKSFWSHLQGNITGAARRSFVKPEDLERTVNIHTDYIDYLDFDITTKDKEFLLQQGYKSTLTYLLNWSATPPQASKSACRIQLNKESTTPNSQSPLMESMSFIDEDDSNDLLNL